MQENSTPVQPPPTAPAAAPIIPVFIGGPLLFSLMDTAPVSVKVMINHLLKDHVDSLSSRVHSYLVVPLTLRSGPSREQGHSRSRLGRTILQRSIRLTAVMY